MQISVSAIDFWDKDEDELKMMDMYKMYPPRFSIAVSGGASATVTACAKIHFQGSVENLDIEVPLEPLSSGMAFCDSRSQNHFKAELCILDT